MGRWQARRSWIAVAGPALVLSLLWLGMIVWQTSKEVNWNPYKPAWWLARETNALGTVRRDGALAELARRIQAGSLRGPSLDRLIDDALAIQGDVSKPWVKGWGHLVEVTDAAGQLSLERWQRYAVQSMPMQFVVRPKVRTGDILPVEVQTDRPRVADAWFEVEVIYPPNLLVGGRSCFARWSSPGFHLTEDDYRSSRERKGHDVLGFSIEKEIRVPEGGQPVELPYTIVASEPPLPQGGRGRSVERKGVLRANTTVVPAGALSATMRSDSTIRDWLAAGVRVTDVRISRRGAYANVNIRTNPVRSPLAFEVWLRAGDRECSIGPARLASPSLGYWHAFGDCPGVQAEKIDVILRPSMESTIQTIDVIDVWSGEVTIRDVIVQYED